jgi:hypothetical protein
MKKFLRFLFAATGIIILCSAESPAQDEMFKALFMYNFTKDIEWPDSYEKGDFIITVVGNKAMERELQKIASKKKVGNQSIVVKSVDNASDIGRCHIVYLGPNESDQVEEIIRNTVKYPTVIITDKPGLMSKGAGINYVKVNGKQKFEISPTCLNKRGLKVNTLLTSLGIVTD